MSSDKTAIHMCDNPHSCPELCAQDGICHIEVMLKQSSKTFVGARGSFQYTFQEMNGSRKKCGRLVEPGQMTHPGNHLCRSSGIERIEDRDGKTPTIKDSNTSNQVRHYCDVRCPSCSYYCHREFGHSGLHKTTHGNMRNTMFVSDDHEIDLVDRKYTAGERGTAEMCNLFCPKMGRGHVHYLECEQQGQAQQCVHKGGRQDKRRHCTRKLEPKPDRDQDELLHARYWDTLGWEDPCLSMQEREEFGMCAFKCDAVGHDVDEQQYCVLPAWHESAVEPPPLAARPTGFAYVRGHKFSCSHVTASPRRHRVFVLDASYSMKGSAWSALLAAFRGFVHSRMVNAAATDLVSVITFDNKASIEWEAQPIAGMAHATVRYRGGRTSLAAGLRCASVVLSRVEVGAYRPVVILFSDGQVSNDGWEPLASHITHTYAKYGLEAFAVGFGSIRLSALEGFAQRLGGSYHHALSGDELKTTFQSISESIGTRVGFTLTKPQPH